MLIYWRNGSFFSKNSFFPLPLYHNQASSNTYLFLRIILYPVNDLWCYLLVYYIIQCLRYINISFNYLLFSVIFIIIIYMLIFLTNNRKISKYMFYRFYMLVILVCHWVSNFHWMTSHSLGEISSAKDTVWWPLSNDSTSQYPTGAHLLKKNYHWELWILSISLHLGNKNKR